MTVTVTIKDSVIYDNIKGWYLDPLTNEAIMCKLAEEKAKAFLSFAYGVWVTSYRKA